MLAAEKEKTAEKVEFTFSELYFMYTLLQKSVSVYYEEFCKTNNRTYEELSDKQSVLRDKLWKFLLKSKGACMEKDMNYILTPAAK